MEKTLEQLSREIDTAMVKEDYNTIVESAREILKQPIDAIGTDTFVRTSVVFAYGLLKLGQNDTVKNVLNSLIKSHTGLIDAYFLLFCIAHEEKNIEEISEFGNKFLELIPDPENVPACITTATQNIHEVVNNYAAALLKSEKYEKAIEILQKGLRFKSDYPLLYVNLGIAYHQYKKPDKAEEILIEGMNKCKDTGEIRRTLGLIYDENHYFMKAEILLRKAVEEGNVEAHIDLGILYNKLSKIYDAEEEIQNYLKHCPGETTATKMLYDIRSLDFFGKPEKKISAAMIVKNEENMLEECIESFREAVDEIVIVDTGSTDKTVEIAEKFNVKLYHHEWKDDFSEARNFSIKKATGDWIFIIDADERLERKDIPKVRSMKWQENYDVLCFDIYSTLPGHLGDANFGKHLSARLFKKKQDIYYYGIVHNVLNIPRKAGVLDVRIYHLGYDLEPEKMRQKFERSIKLLHKQLEESPNDAFVLMNTAQMYLSRNMLDEAEKCSTKLVDLLEKDTQEQEHLLLMGYYQLTDINLRRRQFEKCNEYALRALKIRKDYIDPLLNLGWSYFSQKKYNEAKDALEKFLIYREEYLKSEYFDLLVISKAGGDYEAYYLLGAIYREQGNFDTAKEKFNLALQSNPLYWSVHNSLGQIYLQEGRYTEATTSFENAIKYGYLNREKYGTTGEASDVYKQTIENYKIAIEKDVKAKRSAPTVENALVNIDSILKTENS